MIRNRLGDPAAFDSSPLDNVLVLMSDKCIECRICVRQCAFLKKYGTPKKIADNWKFHEKDVGRMPFECSLCSLCAAVCPVEINPREMFLEMRRYAAAHARTDFNRQKPLLNYEKRGTSKRYSFYGFPAGCDTAFFPGCALAGSRPRRVMQLYDHLQRFYPNLGIILDCCTKPSHDLGRQDYFLSVFSEMLDYIRGCGIKNIIVACPSCYAVFTRYAKHLNTRNVYEILARENWMPKYDLPKNPVTVQDSCVTRFEKGMQDSVRKLIRQQGIAFEEMKHAGKKTLCCGEGGAAHFVSPCLAGNWREVRKQEKQGMKIITYCAGCAAFLGRIGETVHIVDLVFDPAAALSGRAVVSRAPLTYINRLLLKFRFRKKQSYAYTRERSLLFS